MTIYYQETDSKVIFPLPLNTIQLEIRPANETSGSGHRINIFPVYSETGPFQNAWRVVRQFNNRDVATRAINLLEEIEQIVESFQQSRFALTNLPILNSFSANDGSIYFEWSSDDYRVGFNIEPEQNESSWYIVSTKKLGEISASGYIVENDIKNLIVWLLSFVLAYS